MWSNDSNMKKKTKILILITLSFLTAVTLWAASNFVAINLFFASRLSQLSELDLFDIEEDD